MIVMSGRLARRLPHATGAAVGLVTIGLLLSGCSSSSPAASSSSTTPTPSSSTHKKASTKKDKGVTGQVTAESGDTWTVRDKKGTQYTVTVTPQTNLGGQQFPVGDTVRVSGTVNGTTITATQISAAKTKTTASVTSTPTG